MNPVPGKWEFQRNGDISDDKIIFSPQNAGHVKMNFLNSGHFVIYPVINGQIMVFDSFNYDLSDAFSSNFSLIKDSYFYVSVTTIRSVEKRFQGPVSSQWYSRCWALVRLGPPPVRPGRDFRWSLNPGFACFSRHTISNWILIWRRNDLNFRAIQRSRLIRSFNNSDRFRKMITPSRDELQVRVEIIGESCFM